MSCTELATPRLSPAERTATHGRFGLSASASAVSAAQRSGSGFASGRPAQAAPVIAASSAPATWFSAFVAAIRRRIEVRRALAALKEMDIHQLDDIGLSRSDLSRAQFDPSGQDPFRILNDARLARSRGRRHA